MPAIARVNRVFRDNPADWYDALETNDSAVKVPGEPTRLAIAGELASTVRSHVTIDWTVRENVAGSAARAGEAHPPQARLARQAGEGDADGARAGRGAARAVGRGARLAKDHIDIGLFSNQRDEQLAFWQNVVDLPYDHVGKVGGGIQQHRHHMNGSILKLARGARRDNPSPCSARRSDTRSSAIPTGTTSKSPSGRR